MGSTQDDILDASQLPFVGSFSEQVEDLLARVRLSRNEVQNIQYLLDDLRDALSHHWPGIIVHPFGSIVTGLGIKTSDVDCYIEALPGHHLPNPVNYAKSILNRDRMRFTQTFAITTARVPILKFVHVPTGYNCDINFSSSGGVRNSKLIAFLINMEPRALQLAVIIKYWSKVYHFTGTNLMPNYALTMMVIFYLQVRSILPSVAELRKNTRCELVEGWDTSFNVNYVHRTDNTQSLYELLGDFFSYYRNFDYEKLVISPYTGHPVEKDLLKNPHSLPALYNLYKENLRTKFCKVIILDKPVCIQDPFDHSRNCCVAVFPKLFQKIQGHMELALQTYQENDSESFLRELFSLDVPPSLQVPIKGQPHSRKRNRGIHKQMRQVKEQKRQLRRHYLQWQRYKCFQNPF